MLHRLRQCRTEEGGFTLIEILVVILIIGVLAAIAIPSFLNQKGKAYDASAKELARTAQTTAETIATDNGGDYSKVTPTELHKYESSIPISAAEAGNGNAYINPATTGANATNGSASGFEVTAIAANTGDKFTIKRSSTGTISRECVSSKTSCAGTASGSW